MVKLFGFLFFKINMVGLYKLAAVGLAAGYVTLMAACGTQESVSVQTLQSPTPSPTVTSAPIPTISPKPTMDSLHSIT